MRSSARTRRFPSSRTRGPAAAVPTSTPLERRDEDDPLRPLKDLPPGDGSDARLDAATFEESFQVK